MATAPLLPWLGAARTSDTVYSIEARGGLVGAGWSRHVEAFSCAPPGEAPTTTAPRSPGRPPSLAPRPLRRGRAHSSVVYSLKASKRALYSCGGDGELRAWHRSDGRLLRTYRDQTLHHKGKGTAHQKAHGGPARCVLRLGDLIASGGNDKRVKLWLALDPDASHDDGDAPPDGDEGRMRWRRSRGTRTGCALAAVGGAHADKEASDERRLLSASREVILWRIPAAAGAQWPVGLYSVGAADGGLSEALAVFPLAGGAPPTLSPPPTTFATPATRPAPSVCGHSRPASLSRRWWRRAAAAARPRAGPHEPDAAVYGAGGVSVVDAGRNGPTASRRRRGAARDRRDPPRAALHRRGRPDGVGVSDGRRWGVGEPPKVASELGAQFSRGAG